MFKKISAGMKRLLQSAVPAKQALGHEQLRELICAALKEKFPMPEMEYALWVVEIYNDGRVIFQDLNGEYYQVNYAAENDVVTLTGDLVPVKRDVQYIAQQAGGALLQNLDMVGSQWEVVIIRAGKSLTGDYFPRETLAAAIPLFDGSQAFALSQGQHVKEPTEKPVKDMIGYYDNVRMEGEELRARLNLLQTADWLRLMLMDLSKQGKQNLLGISVDLYGSNRVKEVNGEMVRYWDKFTKLNGGGDVVWDPAAGGTFVRALAAGGTENSNKEEDQMKDKLLKLLQARRPDLYGKINVLTVTEDELTHLLEEAVPVQQAAAAQTPSQEDVKKLLQADSRSRVTLALGESNLPKETQERIRARFKDRVVEDEEIQQTIKEEQDYLGKLTQSGRVVGFGDDPRAEVEGEPERLQMALHKLFGVTGEDIKKSDVAPFEGLRQAYVRLTGDKAVRGISDQRLRQTISSATFPSMLGNTLYRRLTQDYNEQNYGERNIINVGSAPDFRTREAVRIGYFGDLSTVDPEADDYQEIAAPGDEKVSYAVTQRGNILTITRKTIINDDLRGVSKMVGRLGRAARRTFAQFVWNFFITNPALDYDSVAWFHASHGNLGSTALGAAAIETGLTNLANMTELGSNKTLGLNFSGGISGIRCWLVVPNALWGTAMKENMREFLDSNLTPNPVRFAFGQSGERIIVNPLLSDVTDWGIFRDPMDVESILIDFLGGQEEPELFLADNPTVGQMFVGDKLQYKIRHEYGGDVVDHRGAFKAVVAG